jgi:type I phosphodiesterase/nucleotide pyrophosphatase
LLITFVALGALLGVFGGLPMAVWHGLRKDNVRDPVLAYGLAAAVAVPLSYVCAAVGIEAASPSLPGALDPYVDFVVPALAVLLAAMPLIAVTYRAAAGRAIWRRGIASVLGAAIAIGAFVLPVRIAQHPVLPYQDLDESPSVPARAPLAPLLFVGIDGGNWTTLRPLLERRALPTFGRLTTDGFHGRVTALWPPFWSAPAWAAILTGYPRAETGIYEELTGHVPGVPPFQVPLTLDIALEPISAFAFVMARSGVVQLTQPPRRALHRAPFWERLSKAGVKTAVVRFRFTYPAAGQADYEVSDWVGDDQWNLLGLSPTSAPEAFWPRAEAARLLESFTRPVSPGEFADLLSQPGREQPRDSALDPVAMLEVALRIDEQTLWAAEGLLRDHPDIAALAVYLGGFDTVCHAFWQYRFPDAFPEARPAAADIAALGRVIDRYWLFLDDAVRALAGAFAREPNVIVVADHGVEPIHHHSLWRGWHARHGGVFIAAGPDVPQRTEEIDVAYADVVPTVLDVAGVRVPRTLPGVSLLRRP